MMSLFSHIRRSIHAAQELPTAVWVAVVVVAMGLMVGCSIPSTSKAEITRAQCLAHSDPEQAIQILEAINPKSLSSKERYAEYALAYSEACYYGRQRIESDSLTLRAVEYFERHGNKQKLARAHFYHGQANYNMMRLTDAMMSFMEAEKLLENTDNYHLLGLVHQAKGDIYGAGCLYRNSYDSYAASKSYFELAESADDIAYADYDLGRLAMAMRDFESADSSLMAAYNYAREHDDKEFLSLIIYHLSELRVQQAEYEECADILTWYEACDCEVYDPSHYHSLMAIICATNDNIDEAFENLALAELCEPRNEHLISYAQYSVHRIIGNDKTALLWLEEATQRQDNTILQVLEQPVLNYQIGQLQSSLMAHEQKERLSRLLNTFIYVSILLVIVIVVTYFMNRIKAKNRDIQHYMDSLNELQLTSGRGSEHLIEAVSQLYKDRLSDLNDLCETYYDHSDTSRQTTKVFEQVRRTIESIKSDESRLKELESLVDRCRNNMMTRLREQCPKLNEKELRVALYSYAGFSTRAICIFVESNPTALSKVKYRIKTKIKESGCADAEILIAAINDL